MTDKESFPKGHIPEEVRQHLHAARDEMHKSLAGLLPPEYVEHRRKARKEVLLAFRGMLDHVLQHLDEQTKKA
jgi:hypothetical protein